MNYRMPIYIARWRRNIREIAVKNCLKSKKSAEKFVRTTSYRHLSDLKKKIHRSSLGPKI